MSDTIRTRSELNDTILQPAISAQDMRDFIVSINTTQEGENTFATSDHVHATASGLASGFMTADMAARIAGIPDNRGGSSKALLAYTGANTFALQKIETVNVDVGISIAGGNCSSSFTETDTVNLPSALTNNDILELHIKGRWGISDATMDIYFNIDGNDIQLFDTGGPWPASYAAVQKITLWCVPGPTNTIIAASEAWFETPVKTTSNFNNKSFTGITSVTFRFEGSCPSGPSDIFAEICGKITIYKG